MTTTGEGLSLFEHEIILLLRENNRILKENHELLVSIDENIRKIKGNTS